MESTKKKIIIVVLLVITGLVSEFVIAGFASDAANYKHTIKSLDDKKATVMKLTAASAGASAAVAAVPGDATTPIANKLADVSTYLLVVLTALFLEKYMLTIAGLLAFKLLIPICCALVTAYLFVPKRWLVNIAKKMLVLSVVIVLVVPLSVRAADFIETTKDVSAETATAEVIDEGTANAISKAKATLNNFIEDVAVMIVTSCLIPILVFVFLLWFIKMLFNINTDRTAPGKRPESVPESVKELP